MAQSAVEARVLRSFIDNISLVLNQIKDGENTRCNADSKVFNRDLFWKKMGAVFQAISMEATKLSLAYSSPPFPSDEESSPLIQSVEKASLALVSLYYSLPMSEGSLLHKATTTAVVEMLDGLKTLGESIDTACGSSNQLQSTGYVWQCADYFSSLPKDNKEAALKLLQETSVLVKDAIQELDEAMEGDGNDIFEEFGEDMNIEASDSEWSESDKQLLAPCTGLIKATSNILKKTRSAVKTSGCCDSCDKLKEFDSLMVVCNELSPAVDDFTSRLYPPITHSNVTEQAEKLSDLNNKVLNFIKHSHLSIEDDEKWINFLIKATAHNLEKIVDLAKDTT